MTVSPPKSIDATGTDDVTVPLCDWFNSLPANSVVDVPEHSRYRCEGGLHLWNLDGLRVAWNGATIFANTLGDDTDSNEWNRDVVKTHYAPHTKPVQHRCHFRTVNCVGTRHYDLHVTGVNPDAGSGPDNYHELWEAQHAIEVHGGEDNRFWRTRGGLVHGDLVYIGNGARATIFCETKMRGAGRQMIAVTDAADTVFFDTKMADGPRAAIDLEPTTEKMSIVGFHMERFEFHNNRLKWLASVSDGEVSNVTVKHGTSDLLEVRCRPRGTRNANWRIEGVAGCRQHQSDHPMMTFFRVDGLEVVGSWHAFREGRSERAVMTSDCTDAVVDGCDWPVYEAHSYTLTDPPRHAEVGIFDSWADVKEAGWN